ncbi:MAG: type IV toxin-antitoxin system AbiEi family antitoxin domain-containing protein [Promethearchaeota archaeon]
MKSTILLKKFYIEDKEFVKSHEIKEYCNILDLNYENVIRYFISRGYLLRIFRGIFYVKHLEELKFGFNKYSHLELVSKGLDLKGIKNWYFSLYTALKLNNATHEYFTIDYVISENLYRNKPIYIADYKFKFMKLKPDLLNFGITENGLKNGIRYSDLEKTIIDFIYIWIYNSIPRKKILIDVSEYTNNLSEKRIKNYAKNYPNSIKEIVEEMF